VSAARFLLQAALELALPAAAGVLLVLLVFLLLEWRDRRRVRSMITSVSGLPPPGSRVMVGGSARPEHDGEYVLESVRGNRFALARAMLRHPSRVRIRVGGPPPAKILRGAFKPPEKK
jgi:hypothetical protein